MRHYKRQPGPRPLPDATASRFWSSFAGPARIRYGTWRWTWPATVYANLAGHAVTSLTSSRRGIARYALSARWPIAGCASYGSYGNGGSGMMRAATSPIERVKGYRLPSHSLQPELQGGI